MFQRQPAAIAIQWFRRSAALGACLCLLAVAAPAAQAIPLLDGKKVDLDDVDLTGADL